MRNVSVVVLYGASCFALYSTVPRIAIHKNEWHCNGPQLKHVHCNVLHKCTGTVNCHNTQIWMSPERKFVMRVTWRLLLLGWWYGCMTFLWPFWSACLFSGLVTQKLWRSPSSFSFLCATIGSCFMAHLQARSRAALRVSMDTNSTACLKQW